MIQSEVIELKRIKLLSSDLINKIAAGEVIEMPASVVKELVENAVDAGATKIEIEASQGGRDIRVSDNGSGIYQEDVPQLFERHATSKISSEEDLWNIGSLGFRGEALASIASIAKVICTTRTQEDENGIKVTCAEGNLTVSETGCAVGTTFEINDLFYNTPARLKFMKKPETEVGYIRDVIESMALSRPDIAFTFIYKGVTKLKTSGSNLLLTTIAELYPQVPSQDLTEITALDEASDFGLSGYASLPVYTRGNKKTIITFVNGRLIQSDCIFQAVKKVYADLIPNGRFPFVVTNLVMPKNQLDVNVHPTKKEVKFADPNQVFRFVSFAFSQVLSVQVPPVLPNSFSFTGASVGGEKQEDTNQPVPYNYEAITPALSFTDAATVSASADNIIERLKNKTLSSKNKIQDKTPSPKDMPPSAISSDSEQIQQETIPDLEISSTVTEPSPFKVIGQIFKTYILVERPEGLQIIDQHIAAERYLYEKLLKGYKEDMPVQPLLTSEVIELTESQVALLKENEDFLREYGFEFRKLTATNISLSKMPQLLAGRDFVKLTHDLLENLQTGGLEDKTDRIIATIACHAAIRSGDVLTIPDMERLVKQWESCAYTYTCPHGRVISSLMSLKSMAALFQRMSHSHK